MGKQRHERALFQVRHYTKEEITLELLEECYYSIARIIEKYGDVYLPLFIRLHNEIEKMKDDNKMKKLALEIAQNCHTFGTQNVTHFVTHENQKV